MCTPRPYGFTQFGSLWRLAANWPVEHPRGSRDVVSLRQLGSHPPVRSVCFLFVFSLRARLNNTPSSTSSRFSVRCSTGGASQRLWWPNLRKLITAFWALWSLTLKCYISRASRVGIWEVPAFLSFSQWARPNNTAPVPACGARSHLDIRTRLCHGGSSGQSPRAPHWGNPLYAPGHVCSLATSCRKKWRRVNILAAQGVPWEATTNAAVVQSCAS